MLNRRELILNTLALVWLRTNTKLGEKPTNAKKERSVVFNKLNLRDEAEWKMRARARKTPRPAETKRDLMVERGWTEATMGFGRGDSLETCSSSQLRTKETVTDGAEVPRRSVSYVEGKKKTSELPLPPPLPVRLPAWKGIWRGGECYNCCCALSALALVKRQQELLLCSWVGRTCGGRGGEGDRSVASDGGGGVGVCTVRRGPRHRRNFSKDLFQGVSSGCTGGRAAKEIRLVCLGQP